MVPITSDQYESEPDDKVDWFIKFNRMEREMEADEIKRADTRR